MDTETWVVGPSGALVVEAETYFGLTLSGLRELVESVRDRLLGAEVSPDSTAAHDLATYFQEHQPAGIAFQDAAQICMRLYATLDGIPPNLHIATSRERLSDAFAILGARGWIHNPPPDVDISSRAFWSGVVASVTAPGRWVLDFDGAERLMIPFIRVA